MEIFTSSNSTGPAIKRPVEEFTNFASVSAW